MDPVQYTTFIEDGELTLRIVRNGILVSRQEGRSAGLGLADEISALRQAAAQLGLKAVDAVLETVERECVALFSLGRPLSDAEIRTLLDLIAHAEAEVVRSKVSHDDQDVGSFVDVSFDTLQATVVEESSCEPAEPVAGEEEEDEFEPDAEMLEVFSMEADELLTNIDTNLERLASSPADRDALWEVRRNAHTFKGAAGIIGLKKPSKLAHRIEDLLDHLAQNEIVPGARVLELITAAAYCLRSITKGDATPGMAARTTEVYRSFDQVMADLTASPVDPQPEIIPATEPLTPPAAADVVDPTPAVETPSPRRPIVRVSISRLDNLVGTVRDLVVSRSRVDQRMAEFETQIENLGSAIRRLQAANAKIENDFEASMLGAYVPSLFSRPRASQEFTFALETPDNGEFDALEFDRYTDFHESSRELSEAIQECFAIGTSLEALKGGLESVIEDQRRLIEETQEKVMQIRLIKFESLATRLQRAVRVTCEEEGRNAELVLEDQDVELDTDVLDSLVEPLMHLLRNAVVHGIEPPDTRRLLGKPETGRVTVRVTNQETHVELKVSDDGRGIDTAALKMRAAESGVSASDADLVSILALPGFTTAEKLTMSAGRGVGMGIVKESVEARGGSLSVETSLHRGTTFTIKAPLAFAVTQALLVRSGSHLAAVPFKVVKRILEVSPANLRQEGQAAYVEIGSLRAQVCRLGDHFRDTRAAETGPSGGLLIETDTTQFVLVVNEILRTEDVAVRPLYKPLDKTPGVLGAAVLGNGEAVPVLDVTWFPNAQPLERSGLPEPEPVEPPSFILVVDDSPSVRHMTSKVLTAAGWNVTTARDGVEALEILNGADLPKVILTDVEMPRMDGYELAAAVLGNDALRHLPLVFITSRAGERHKERAAELGVTEYLTKPFIDSELLSTVERLAAQPAEVLI